MTHQEFARELQGYYGQWSPTERKYTMAWLEQEVPQEDLPRVLAEVFRSFSKRWGMAPSIADIEPARAAVSRERRNAELEQQWREQVKQLENRDIHRKSLPDPASINEDDDPEEAQRLMQQFRQKVRSLAAAKSFSGGNRQKGRKT